MDRSMWERYERTCLRYWISFVHSLVAQNFSLQEIRLVQDWRTGFKMKGPPHENMANLIIELCLNISRSVTSLVVIYTCYNHQASEYAVNSCWEASFAEEASI